MLLPLFCQDGSLQVLFTKRTDHLNHHRGEICFPGGVRHDEYPDLMTTALRESWEEVGIRPYDVTVLGTLDDIVPIDQGDLLDARMKSLGNEHQYRRLDGWPHTMDAAVPVNEYCRYQIEQFLKRHLGSRSGQQAGGGKNSGPVANPTVGTTGR